jgi:hypothetical protein
MRRGYRRASLPAVDANAPAGCIDPRRALRRMPADPRAMLDRLFEQWQAAGRVPARVAG